MMSTTDTHVGGAVDERLYEAGSTRLMTLMMSEAQQNHDFVSTWPSSEIIATVRSADQFLPTNALTPGIVVAAAVAGVDSAHFHGHQGRHFQ